MKNLHKFLLTISVITVSIFLYSFNTDSILSKLKSLSYLLRLVDRYYVEEVELNTIIDGAMHGLLEKLDPHSQYIPSEEFEMMNESIQGEFEGIGIEFAILEGYITVISPIPETPSDRAGLIGGDKIIKINGESAYKITQDEVFKKLRGPKNSSVTVTINRSGLEKPFDVVLIRDKIPIYSLSAALLYENNVGYIKLNRFSKNSSDELLGAIDSLQLSGMNKLILDLRNNGGGLMDQAVEIVDYFINSNDTILFTKGRISSANEVFYATKKYNDLKMPISVLINRASASASEIVAGAIQDLDRGLVVGETSFGKGLVQKQFLLDDGSAARITIAQYYTPSGRLIQRDFSGGVDEYYLNLGTENRETPDSLLLNRPTYTTKSGRVVYGGGGITPDIHVPISLNFSEKTQDIITHPNRLFFKYAQFIKNEFENMIFKDYLYLIKTKDDIIQINNFLDWINKQDTMLIVSSDDVKEDWEYIKNRVYAEIANNLWGKDFYYYILLLQDNLFNAALNTFEE